MEEITCEHRRRMGTKDDLITEFKDGTVFDKYVEEHPEFTICDGVIGIKLPRKQKTCR